MIKALVPLLAVFVVSCSHSPTPNQGAAGYIGKTDSTWEAWTNDMPPGPRSLHVVGQVTLSDGRQTAVIQPIEGMSGVHCRVDVIDSGGVGTTALKEQKVSYVDPKYQGTDQQVTVHFPDGTTLDVPLLSAQ